MKALELLKRAQADPGTDEDGNRVEFELLPGLTAQEIDDFAATLPCPLPADVRDLLTHARGFYGSAAETVDFTGRECSFEMQEIFPYGVPIAHDGFGNFWVADLTPQSETFGPIYFACHDAPVILYQSADLTHFLEELFKLNVPPHKSLIDDVHEDRLFDVWRKNPGVVSRADALASEDGALAAFAGELDDAWSIIDLRGAEVGFGFSWGRFGPKTEIRRHGHELIFACKKPKGLLARLLGR